MRDIDLLKQYKKREAGFTITILDGGLRKEIDPFASSAQNRNKPLEKSKEAGIKSCVFISPILPYLKYEKKMVLETKHCSDLYMFEILNGRGSVWDSVKS